MKKASYLLSLLGAVIVCTQIAHSIICFTCERQPSNWKCLQMTICPDNENACLTMRDVDETGDSAKVLITKKCGQACPTESNNSSSAPSRSSAASTTGATCGPQNKKCLVHAEWKGQSGMPLK